MTELTTEEIISTFDFYIEALSDGNDPVLTEVVIKSAIAKLQATIPQPEFHEGWEGFDFGDNECEIFKIIDDEMFGVVWSIDDSMYHPASWTINGDATSHYATKLVPHTLKTETWWRMEDGPGAMNALFSALEVKRIAVSSPDVKFVKVQVTEVPE